MDPEMKIKAISRANLQDFFSLFDETTCRDCYCTALYSTSWKEYNPGSLENRRKRMALIEGGGSDGYLFYKEETLIGWIQVANIADLPNLLNVSPFFATVSGRVITCFKVKPEYRGKGLSAQMISLICHEKDAAHGRLFAIPSRYEGEFIECRSWTGTVNTFAKNGFVEIQKGNDDYILMERISAQKQVE